ncbi:MAG: hypothetical protein LBQ66_08605 [Planctomycetaceae bacterium]|nr:hypothetical protein [Planctomycetaceae bacterium]
MSDGHVPNNYDDFLLKLKMFFTDFDNSVLAGQLSGRRFSVVYKLSTDDKAEALRLADDICAEQTVEFPVRLLPDGVIPERVVGRIERFETGRERASSPASVGVGASDVRVGVVELCFFVTISYAEELAASELTQFLNVILGNISMKQKIQVISITPSEGIFEILRGAKFGVSGIRGLLGVPVRPLLFTALKPMGLSADNLANLASLFTEGGIDIIKDDHGLSNQSFAPFKDRVIKCAAAVREANAKFNRNSIYVPNITAPSNQIIERAYFAKERGAGGVMISPGLAGLDVMRQLAGELGLPIFAHPAFIGGMVMNHGGVSQGLTYGVLLGTIMRLAGADATIFPNYGGRFPLTQEDCTDIVTKCREPLNNIPQIFPSPAGGMELKNIKTILQNYGKDTLMLVGSGLFSQSNNIIANCKKFREEAESEI